MRKSYGERGGGRGITPCWGCRVRGMCRRRRRGVSAIYALYWAFMKKERKPKKKQSEVSGGERNLRKELRNIKSKSGRSLERGERRHFQPANQHSVE